MILAIDCGNSRLKWGLHDGHRWLRTGAASLPELARLKAAWKKIPRPTQSSSPTSPAGVRRRLEAALSAARR